MPGNNAWNLYNVSPKINALVKTCTNGTMQCAN